MEFFKSQGLNLYIIKDKQPAQRIYNDVVPLKDWASLTNFTKYIKQIKNDDNIGFLSGYQYKSKKYIEILDFDIFDKKTKIHEPTKKLYEEFEKLDTNNKKGFFSGSTCHNYGVMLDTTNNKALRDKIEECKQINKNKCKIEELEILYNNNVVLPPSITTCKQCNRQHKHRKLLNDEAAFCIPNEAQTQFIINLLDKFITSKCIVNTDNTKTTTKTTTKKIIQVKPSNLQVNRIHKDKLLKILECLSDTRFNCKMDDGWGQLLVKVANANNDIEVIKKFHQRSAVGNYSNISFDEIHKAFNSVKIIETFNFGSLWKMAKDDNETLYNTYFNKYDEAKFEFENITFKDDNDNDTQYINYNQVCEYFQNTKYRFIKSGLGTGKTTFIKQHIENNINSRIVFFTMRQSLANSINNDFEKFGFTNYLNNNGISHLDSKIIISIDSITKLITNGDYDINPYDIVICDEIASLLSHFSYKEMKTPELNYKIFKNIIKSAKQCYFMDGDISNREISWFNKYIKTENDNVKKPLNNMLTGLKYDLQISYCKNGQYNKFIDDLEKGKKICIVSMSSTEAKAIYALLSDKYKCKLICGDSSDFEKRELQNINTIVQNLDCFIYSPTISVGVNIDVKHFDNIYGYICSGSVCPRDYFQMLARVRNPKNNTIHILLSDFNIKLTGLFDVIEFERCYNIMYDDETVAGISYIKLWNYWEQTNANNCWMDIFKWYANKKGHKITILQHSKEDYQEQNKIMKDNIVKYGVKLNVQKAEIVYNAVLLKQKPDSVIDHNPKMDEDIKIRKQLISKGNLTDEDIELLQTIDEKNNWDNMEEVQKRIKVGNASNCDKLNFEKSLYYHYFGLDTKTTLDDFKDYYYNKIDNVKLYNQMNNIKELIEVCPLFGYGQDFEAEIVNKKIKYVNEVFRIINNHKQENTNFINSNVFDDKTLNQVINNDDYNFVFGIVNKSTSNKNVVKKDDANAAKKELTRTQLIKKVKDLLVIFGYDIEYMQKRNNGIRDNVYKLELTKTIKQYLDNQTKLKLLKIEREAAEAEKIEYDF